MISFNLVEPSNNLDLVVADIKSLGVNYKVLPTTYLLNTLQTQNRIQNVCISHLESDDSMIICKAQVPFVGLLTADQWKQIKENFI